MNFCAMSIFETLKDPLLKLWQSTGLYQSNWQNYVMMLIAFVLFYLAIAKKFEPLLLLPIAFGMLVVNIPGGADILYFPGYGTEVMHPADATHA